MRELLFFVTLFVCALTDIVTYRIKNTILLISAAGLLFCDSIHYTGIGIREDIASMCVIILILFPVYLTGLIAAGDIKLLALSAMYTGLPGFCTLAAGAVTASICLSFFIGLAKHKPLNEARFPFAFALFLGAIPIWG